MKSLQKATCLFIPVVGKSGMPIGAVKSGKLGAVPLAFLLLRNFLNHFDNLFIFSSRTKIKFQTFQFKYVVAVIEQTFSGNNNEVGNCQKKFTSNIYRCQERMVLFLRRENFSLCLKNDKKPFKRRFTEVDAGQLEVDKVIHIPLDEVSEVIHHFDTLKIWFLKVLCICFTQFF